MSTENSTKYEIMIIFSPELVEDKFEKELEEVRKLIKSNDGEIYNEDIWGLRDFAFRIKKEEQGYYAVLNFTMDPNKIDELEKPLNLNQDVLRYLVTKPPHNFEIKSLEDYEKEAEAEEEQKEEKKEEKPKKKVVKKEIKEEKIEKEEEKKEERPKEKVEKEEPKEEPKEEVEKEELKEEKTEEPEEKEELKEEPEEEKEEEPKKEEKEEKKPSKEKLDEVDEKLKSIINDPDISL